jgi:hypothetical protein
MVEMNRQVARVKGRHDPTRMGDAAWPRRRLGDPGRASGTGGAARGCALVMARASELPVPAYELFSQTSTTIATALFRDSPCEWACDTSCTTLLSCDTDKIIDAW